MEQSPSWEDNAKYHAAALYIITTNFLLKTDDKSYAHDGGKYKHFVKEQLKLELNYMKGNTSEGAG
jgi:hypothetical protein